MKLTVVGTGYVGLVTGTCLADIGHHVACVDIDPEKIRLLRSGVSPIYEPGLEALIQLNVIHERLTFTTDIEDALEDSEITFIAVGTPEGEDGSADLGYVRDVAEKIGQLAKNDMTVVVKSTVPVGTCDIVNEIIQDTLQKRRSQLQLEVASNPEFLKEGSAIDDFRLPDRIVCGVASTKAADAFRKVYAPFITDDPGKLLLMDRRSSELTKYGANAMLATRISFMNELSRLCETVGANIDNVRRGMGSDPRIGRKFLYAGPGFGGSCFPKDVMALLKSGEKNGVPLEVLAAVTSANKAQKQYVTAKIKRHFGNLRGKKVCVWGLAFKPGTDDVRETPAHAIITELLAEGATVQAHDPKAIESYARCFGKPAGLSFSELAYSAVDGAHALVLVTEWSEYKRPNWEKIQQLMQEKVVFDFRNQYVKDELLERGFHYECVGRPDSVVQI
jgi:UDPglucose 6-dehydrogenase